MKILLHDFAGHPFQAGLSRRLAARGHRVTHAWFAGDQGPKGVMRRTNNDPETLWFEPLGTDIPYSKTNFLKRRSGDRAYGRALAGLAAGLRPDVVISGNTPTESQETLVERCRALGVPFVYWCQDFYSIAASELLARKFPGPGHIAGGWYQFLERRQMHRADGVVLITGAFLNQTRAWNVPDEKITVIPNWGALDNIGVLPRQNQWAETQGLSVGTRFLYSGTLAMKHNPALLSGLSHSLHASEELTIVSAGVGMDTLHRQSTAGQLPRTRLLPLQRFEDFPQVLASGDILLAVIEEGAGRYSVPSKILSYLCAGRPIVLAAPAENLAARMVTESGAGLVVAPGDIKGFVAVAKALANDPELARKSGAAGRLYAERHFDLDVVARAFETVVEKAQARAWRRAEHKFRFVRQPG